MTVVGGHAQVTATLRASGYGRITLFTNYVTLGGGTMSEVAYERVYTGNGANTFTRHISFPMATLCTPGASADPGATTATLRAFMEIDGLPAGPERDAQVTCP